MDSHKAPEHLSPEAKIEWERITSSPAVMAELGLSNFAEVAIYCQSWARMAAAERHINQHGVIVPAARTGAPIVNPHLAIANRAAAAISRQAKKPKKIAKAATTDNVASNLPPKQQEFVRQYLVDLNASEAYRRAGYITGNANVNASRLLANANVAAAVHAAMEKRAARVELTQDVVLAGLLKEAQREDETASHGARVTAWTTLARHLGMLQDKVQHSTKNDAPLVAIYQLPDNGRE